jgi:heme A synthase
VVPAEFTGYFMAAAAAAGVLIGLLANVRMHGRVARQELHLVMLVLSVVTYLFQLVIGILLVISPRDHGQVYNLAYLEIALFAVALSRAWALVQGRHLRPSSHPETSRPAPPRNCPLKLASAKLRPRASAHQPEMRYQTWPSTAVHE